MVLEDTESSIDEEFENESLTDFFVRNAKIFLSDFSVHGFRLYFGFILCHSIINFQSFLTLALPIIVFDYVTLYLVNHIIQEFLPLQLQGYFTNIILTRIIACGLVCIAFQQSLLLYLSSVFLYNVFCYFSRYFSSRVLESTTIMFAFSSPWYIFPSLVKMGLSIMFVLDSFLSLTSIQALLRCHFMTTILNDLGIQIPEKKSSDYRYNLPYLSEEDNLQYRLLRNRYLQDKDEDYVQNTLNDIDEFLVEEYKKNPAKYVPSNGREIVLPLEWDALLQVLDLYPHEKQMIINQYYQHQIHSAWRMIQPKNHWIEQDSKYEVQHQTLTHGIHQELIVMIWFHHMNSNDQYKFIQVLSMNNRLNNNHDLQPGPDKPADTKYFRINLIQSTRCLHSLDFISDELLQNLFDSFLHVKWLNQLRSMEPRDVEKVKHSWLRLCEGLMLSQEQLRTLSVFKIEKSDKTDFIIKMYALFGRGWLNSNNHAKQVDHCFKFNSEIYICPVEQYKKIFSESLDQYFLHESAIQTSLNLPRM